MIFVVSRKNVENNLRNWRKRTYKISLTLKIEMEKNFTHFSMNIQR